MPKTIDCKLIDSYLFQVLEQDVEETGWTVAMWCAYNDIDPPLSSQLEALFELIHGPTAVKEP